MRYIVEDRQPEVMVFDSKEDLLDYVEWDDVEDGEYRVWDSNGIRCDLVPGEYPGEVAVASTGVQDAQEVARAIIRYLQHIAPEPAEHPYNYDLPALIDRLIQRSW